MKKNKFSLNNEMDCENDINYITKCFGNMDATLSAPELEPRHYLNLYKELILNQTMEEYRVVDIIKIFHPFILHLERLIILNYFQNTEIIDVLIRQINIYKKCKVNNVRTMSIIISIMSMIDAYV
jgi:hypothetical protein